MKDCPVCNTARIKEKASTCANCRKELRDIGNYTKADLKVKRSNWWSARIPIAKHARKVFLNSDQKKECCNCGYDKHYEVCHIKAVSEFEDDITIREINKISNLIPLCPNCHWEFDNGLLQL